MKGINKFGSLILAIQPSRSAHALLYGPPDLPRGARYRTTGGYDLLQALVCDQRHLEL